MSIDPARHSEETYRGTVQGRTPDGERATLIVTLQGLGQAVNTWVTFLGALTTTLAMTDDETDRLIELLHGARGAQGPR